MCLSGAWLGSISPHCSCSARIACIYTTGLVIQTVKPPLCGVALWLAKTSATLTTPQRKRGIQAQQRL